MTMFERLAKLLGWKTEYHVSYISPNNGAGYMAGDLTLTVRPWLTCDNMKEARKVVADHAGREQKQITVVSVTRL